MKSREIDQGAGTRSRSAGAFLVVAGPDGVGKTTVASAVLQLRLAPTAYFHFRPPIRRPMLSTPPPNQQAIAKRKQKSFPVAGWARIMKNFVLFWIGYLIRVRPALRRSTLVVGDRWAYGYIAQPEALGFSGPEWLARVVIRLLPQPDLVVNLTAPATIIRQRKKELSLEEIVSELDRWAKIPAARIRTFTTETSVQGIAQQILIELQLS